jgi:hypothetical protein
MGRLGEYRVVTDEAGRTVEKLFRPTSSLEVKTVFSMTEIRRGRAFQRSFRTACFELHTAP